MEYKSMEVTMNILALFEGFQVATFSNLWRRSHSNLHLVVNPKDQKWIPTVVALRLIQVLVRITFQSLGTSLYPPGVFYWAPL